MASRAWPWATAVRSATDALFEGADCLLMPSTCIPTSLCIYKYKREECGFLNMFCLPCTRATIPIRTHVATASKIGTSAFGNNAQATGDWATALGQNALAGDFVAVAVGYNGVCVGVLIWLR